MATRRRRVFTFRIDLHTARGVDARPDLEDDVVDRDRMLLQSANLNDRLQPLAGLFVQAFEAVIGQNPVFAHQRDDVRGDAHHHQVQQTFHFRERQPFVKAVSLQHLESYPATRQLLEWIGAVGPFGIEYRHRFGNLFSRQVVVADDHVNSPLLRVSHFFGRFDSAIEGDDHPDAFALGMVDRLVRNAVPFGVAVGDVEHQRFVTEPAQKRIDQGHSRGAVYVVIAVNHDALAPAEGQIHPFDRLPHVFHQEWVVQVFELGIKELPCFLFCFDATLNKQVGKDRRNLQRGGQSGHFSRFPLLLENPSFFC